ncbi:MAG TPA: signal recognition particle protein [Candidatus Methanoperedens sp.]|nr:signal recognition particle protein [Candidatus Methanoperedens sp.]
MFERLSEKLDSVFKKLRGHGSISPELIKATLREIRLALLEADVNYKVAKELERRIEERAAGAEIAASLTPAQQVIKIVRDELTAILGGTWTPIQFAPPPAVTPIMLVGLQGSGKTTSAAKLALRLTKEGKRPLLIAADVYRPAAQDQLRTLGEQIGVPVVGELGVSPVELARRGVTHAKHHALHVAIIDTAGRLQIDEPLMAELRAIKEAVNPTEILMVADAMTGQEAVNIAAGFHQQVGLTGVILTKLDGDARGGAALSIRSALGVPLKFVGVGERPEQFEPFHPDRMATRILGMGDVLTLIERAGETVDAEQAKELGRKLRKKGEFDLEDFRQQLLQVRKMGSLASIMKMLPGAGRLKLDDAELDEKQLVRVDAIISSMTPHERRKPQIIAASRRLRIAKGSGTTVSDVNRLLKQFTQAQRMMKQVSKMTAGGKGAKGRPRLPWG